MMGDIILNVNDLDDIKKLSSVHLTGSSSSSNSQQQQSKKHFHPHLHHQPTTVASNVTISNSGSSDNNNSGNNGATTVANIVTLLGGHSFVSTPTAAVAVSNGASANVPQQTTAASQRQESYLQQQQQAHSPMTSNQQNVSAAAAITAATVSSIMVDHGQLHIGQEHSLSDICRENEKLSNIARICIHLVDRCRGLNKSKQFTEDLTRLASMIDDFNRHNVRNALPEFNTNAGLVFGNASSSSNATVSTTTITPVPSNNTNHNITGGSSHHKLSIGSNGNVLFIPIGSTAGTTGSHHQHQSTQQHLSIHQFVTEEEEEAVHKIQQHHLQQQQEARNKQQQQQTPNNLKPNRKSNTTTNTTATSQQQQMIAAMQQHQELTDEQIQHQQSILFKKLTESGQIIAAELTATTGKEVSIGDNGPGSGGHSQASPNGNQMLAIPLNLNDHNALFSLVNQMDTSNIENTPNLNNKATGKYGKVFKCNMCAKVFANSYNLNRHTKSHTGFQPFECYYPDCRKRFNYNYHLKRHLETHTGERPFVCTWPSCDQRFNRKYNLNRHLWIHTEHKSKSGGHHNLHPQ